MLCDPFNIGNVAGFPDEKRLQRPHLLQVFLQVFQVHIPQLLALPNGQAPSESNLLTTIGTIAVTSDSAGWPNGYSAERAVFTVSLQGFFRIFHALDYETDKPGRI